MKESAEFFKEAAEQAPSNPTYNLNYVHVLEILTQYQTAFNAIRSFLSSNPLFFLPSYDGTPFPFPFPFPFPPPYPYPLSLFPSPFLLFFTACFDSLLPPFPVPLPIPFPFLIPLSLLFSFPWARSASYMFLSQFPPPPLPPYPITWRLL